MKRYTLRLDQSTVAWLESIAEYEGIPVTTVLRRIIIRAKVREQTNPSTLAAFRAGRDDGQVCINRCVAGCIDCEGGRG